MEPSNMFSALDKTFGLSSNVPAVGETTFPPEPIVKSTPIEDDMTLARNTLRTLLSQGSDAAEKILSIAQDSEQPRAFEVASEFLKSVSDVAKDLMELQKRRKELETVVKPTKIGTQNVFVGSTNELFKAIREQAQEITVEAQDVEVVSHEQT